MSPRFRRIVSISIRIPIVLSIGFSLVYLAFLLEGWLRILYIAVMALIGGGTFIWYAVNASKLAKRTEALLDILYKELNPEKFIAESEKLLAKTRNKTFRITILLNLAVGYEAIGDFSGAIRVTKSIDVEKADTVSKAIFFSNATAFYAECGAPFEAAEAYTSGKPYFEKAEKSISKAYILLSRGLYYFSEDRFEDALDSFEKARGIGFDDRHSLTKLQLFEGRTLAKLGKIKEAKAVYHKVVQKNTYPYILSQAKAELATLENA